MQSPTDFKIKPSKKQTRENQIPFGKGPWPCLNPVAEHYKEKIIKNCRITYNKGRPIGTFCCDCGYSYERKGPDQSWDDKLRKDRVKVFGRTWEQKLRECILTKGMKSPSQLAKVMGCYTPTIVAYAGKLGLDQELEGRINKDKYKVTKGIMERSLTSKIFEIRQVVMEYMLKNPLANRSEIQKNNCAEVTYLKRYDYEWLETVLPPPNCLQKARGKESNELLESSKDELFYQRIITAFKEIKTSSQQVRVTQTLLLKKASCTLDKSAISQYPKTFLLLKELSETIEDYRMRRIKALFDKMMQDGITPTKANLIRGVGLKPLKVTLKIDNYIDDLLTS